MIKVSDYQFINMAFLGSDSIIGSRAGHAVQLIAPKHYSDFQKAMYAHNLNLRTIGLLKKL